MLCQSTSVKNIPFRDSRVLQGPVLPNEHVIVYFICLVNKLCIYFVLGSQCKTDYDDNEFRARIILIIWNFSTNAQMT